MARLASPTAMRWSRHAALMREAGELRLAAKNGAASRYWSRADCLGAALRRLDEARAARLTNAPARFALEP